MTLLQAACIIITSQLLLVLTSVSGQSNVDNNRIIGGKEAASGTFPYAVSLADDIGSFCGGSLISSDAVLTAAHCQGGRSNKVVVGRRDLSDVASGEEIPVSV